MPNPRTPTAKAKVSGAAMKNPQRFRERGEPKVAALGDAPAWMSAGARAAWEGFRREIPWLTEADRCIVEVAATLRGRMADEAGKIGAPAFAQLRMCLAVLGATPADRSKVGVQPGEDEDPTDAFFTRPN